MSWLLEKLFDKSKNTPALVFKGGTSLSKAYQLINRFSEDIDLTINRHDLGFNDTDETIIEMGSKRRKRYFELLFKETINIINENIAPSIRNKISDELTEEWSCEIDFDNNERVVFHYPSCFNEMKNQYLRSNIILEFGSRGDTFPTEHKPISSYIGAALPELDLQMPTVTTLQPIRTFLEKILILHKIAHQPNEKPINNRLSRHYHDIITLHDHNLHNKIQQSPDLIEKVAIHNTAYFKSAQASYETARFGSLRLIPKSTHRIDLEHDYKMMRNMFIDEPIPFENLINKIQEIENKLNSLKVI